MDFEPHAPIEVFGLSFNQATMIMSWLVMLLLWVVGYLCVRRMTMVPSRFQAAMEMLVDFFDEICRETFGIKRGRRFLPYVGTLFLFIWVSNIIGVIPGMEEPTRDVNTPWACGLFAFFTAHLCAIRIRGLKAWALEFFEPSFTIKGYWVPNVFLFPLNLAGEIGKIVSHSFRLFGNIFGGVVIISVVSSLAMQVALPPFLLGFFGIFVGTVQAFVFAMLALTYAAVQIGEEGEIEKETAGG
ncbi:MAG: F0F1 ATP synthase subunit A [Planctomycetes bacterium]|nr:F0F1 ATP synthase subunit A [Planctomycetota bacterium]